MGDSPSKEGRQSSLAEAAEELRRTLEVKPDIIAPSLHSFALRRSSSCHSSYSTICSYSEYSLPDVEKPPPPIVTSQVKIVRRMLGINAEEFYNFAVCGESGTGKSSFINAARGLTEDTPTAKLARESCVECTSQIEKYHLEGTWTYFWDLPGGGTPQHPGETYFEDKLLYAFDAVLILNNSPGRPLSNQIAKRCHQEGVPYALILTKADEIMWSRLKARGIMKVEQASEETLEQIKGEVRASFRKSLKDTKQPHLIEAGFFIVSSRDFNRGVDHFDTKALMEYVKRQGEKRQR